MIENVLSKCEDDELISFLEILTCTFKKDETIQVCNKKTGNEFFEKIYNNLLNKNIFVKDTIIDEDSIIISIVGLSLENIKKFKEKTNINKKYEICEDTYKLIIEKSNKSEEQLLNEINYLLKFLDIQDIERGFLSKEKFLIQICDCGKVEGLKEYTNDFKIEIKFDEAKMEKSFEEYLKEKNYSHLYVCEEDRIYLDNKYLDAHKRYLGTITD